MSLEAEYRPFFSFEGATAARRRWVTAFLYFLRKLTLRARVSQAFSVCGPAGGEEGCAASFGGLGLACLGTAGYKCGLSWYSSRVLDWAQPRCILEPPSRCFLRTWSV